MNEAAHNWSFCCYYDYVEAENRDRVHSTCTQCGVEAWDDHEDHGPCPEMERRMKAGTTEEIMADLHKSLPDSKYIEASECLTIIRQVLNRHLTFQEINCTHCDGKGWIEGGGSTMNCPWCQGNGKVLR